MEPESKQVSDKVDFKPKLVKRNKKSFHIDEIHQDDITIVNIAHQMPPTQFYETNTIRH
jgi:hypothetical protein